MRGVLIVAALVGLSACAGLDGPSSVGVAPGWRTVSGTPLSSGEVAALGRSCLPRSGADRQPIDPDDPVADPLRDNPAYHPGGEGLANAPPVGIAAAGRAIEPATLWRATRPQATAIEQCLFGQGIVRTW